MLTYTGGTSISSGGEAEVTYTLEGATFAGTVPASAVTGSNLASKRERGGTAGDVSVTFLVEATSDFSSGSAITFEVPLLNVTGAVLESGAGPDDPPEAVGVGITTSISSIRSTGTPFPLDVLGPDDNVDTTKPEEDEITYLQEQVYSTKDPALSFTWAWGETELVHVKDRKVIIKVGADATDPSDDTKAASAALRIGTIDVEPATGTIKDLGGEDAAVDASTRELGDGLSGDVDVTVYGRFQTGDEIYLGAKRMSITGGVATGDVDIEDLLENEKGGLKVVYVPGGVDDLRPTTFTGIGAMDFNDDDNSPDVVAVFAGLYGVTQGKLEFKGFSNQGYAYGVVRGGGGDQSFVRIGCNSTAACQVFVDCKDQSGMSYFGELDAMIGPGATEVVSSDTIAEVLGGGWSKGRGELHHVVQPRLGDSAHGARWPRADQQHGGGEQEHRAEHRVQLRRVGSQQGRQCERRRFHHRDERHQPLRSGNEGQPAGLHAEYGPLLAEACRAAPAGPGSPEQPLPFLVSA